MTAKTTRAPHAQKAAFDRVVALCEAAVTDDSMHFAAHYRYGVMSFSVGLLDDIGTFGPDAGLLDVPNPRAVLERVGRQMSFLHTRMNRALSPLESGYLIRMVLLFQRGAVVYNHIRPGEYLVCSRIDADPRGLDAADARAADLVDEIRDSLGLRSQNPGGFTTVTQIRRGFDTGVGAPEPRTEGDLASAPDALGLCQDAVHLDDLHYVAYFHDLGLLFSVDVLDHDALVDFFQTATSEQRRRHYAEIGRLMHSLTQQINSSLLAPLGGPLVQLVTDVEEGAAYYVHLPAGDYLVGATLDQSRVAMADAVVRRLAEALGSLSPTATGTTDDGLS